MEADLLTGPKHTFWKMAKGSILYIGGKKAGNFLKIWRGKVAQVLHLKAGGSTDGVHNVMLLRKM